MAETYVSATDFRVHLKDWANQVASGGEPVVMARHGFDMGVFISCDDYRKLARIKANEKGKEIRVLPEFLDEAQVVRIYEQTQGARDDETIRWRARALIWLGTRKRGPPPQPPS